MKAKELFEKLGYEQKIYDNKKHCVNGFEYVVNGIEYIKRDKESEMKRIGMIRTKCIDFYLDSKEIEMYYHIKFKDNSEKNGETSILNMELFNAIQKQIEELGWDI